MASEIPAWRRWLQSAVNPAKRKRPAGRSQGPRIKSQIPQAPPRELSSPAHTHLSEEEFRALAMSRAAPFSPDVIALRAITSREAPDLGRPPKPGMETLEQLARWRSTAQIPASGFTARPARELDGIVERRAAAGEGHDADIIDFERRRRA